MRAEVENRMHARMLQERQAGNNLTDEQLEAYIKERCVPRRRGQVLRAAPGRLRRGIVRWRGVGAPARAQLQP